MIALSIKCSLNNRDLKPFFETFSEACEWSDDHQGCEYRKEMLNWNEYLKCTKKTHWCPLPTIGVDIQFIFDIFKWIFDYTVQMDIFGYCFSNNNNQYFGALMQI